MSITNNSIKHSTTETTTANILPGLPEYAAESKRAEQEDLLAQIRELYGHLAVRVTFMPDGRHELQARPPELGEAPGITVVDETGGIGNWVDQQGGWQEYAEQVARPVPEEIHQRALSIEAAAAMFADALGEGRLARAAKIPLIKASRDITEVARRAGSHQTAITPEEVARAQRDLFFLEQAAIVALGNMEIAYTFVSCKRRKKTGHYSYAFTYQVTTETWDFEGDFDDDDQETIDAMQDGVPYIGELEIAIDPEKRISISYRPDQISAKVYHQTEDLTQRGDRLVVHQFDDLNLRIDLDPKSPSGLAMDIGRSQYDTSSTFLRDADLLGKVMQEANPETGSHVYDGFTSEMLADFRPMAEALIVRLSLGFQEYEATQKNRPR